MPQPSSYVTNSIWRRVYIKSMTAYYYAMHVFALLLLLDKSDELSDDKNCITWQQQQQKSKFIIVKGRSEEVRSAQWFVNYLHINICIMYVCKNIEFIWALLKNAKRTGVAGLTTPSNVTHLIDASPNIYVTHTYNWK